MTLLHYNSKRPLFARPYVVSTDDKRPRADNKAESNTGKSCDHHENIALHLEWKSVLVWENVERSHNFGTVYPKKVY